jgi:hypothetical protein
MSTNRHYRAQASLRQSRFNFYPLFLGEIMSRWNRLPTIFAIFLIAGIFAFSTLNGADPNDGQADPAAPAAASVANEGSAVSPQGSERVATALVERILEYLTWGPPLEAKLRLRAWAAGREVVEVGRYEQAGQGTGWIQMVLQVPIADGKAHWQQTSDGRLAWTREELAGEVKVRRVDLGRLEELLPKVASVNGSRVPPKLRVGGLAEIIDRIQADYDLSLSEGSIEGVKMVVLKGLMRDTMFNELKEVGGGSVSELVPIQVRIAIPAESLSQPLPARIEFWSGVSGRLISLLEIYDSTTIESPPIERFRFEAGGNDFTNETELYLRRFNPALAENAVEVKLR